MNRLQARLQACQQHIPAMHLRTTVPGNVDAALVFLVQELRCINSTQQRRQQHTAVETGGTAAILANLFIENDMRCYERVVARAAGLHEL